MGDDLLSSCISFYALDVTDTDVHALARRFNLIARERQYERLNIEVQIVYSYGYKYLKFHYTKPDYDADRDGGYECHLMIFHERVAVIMRSLYGPEGPKWDLSTEHRLP